MSIPTRLAGERIRGSLTRSLTTGYLDIAHGNGRYVAVGYQLGADISIATAGDGPAVTVAGASESIDGGYTWRDVELPYLGQKQVYRKVAYANRRWCASSGWGRSGVNQHYPVIAADRPLGTPLSFWNPAFTPPNKGTPANNTAVVDLAASPDGFMFVGQLGASALAAYSANGIAFDSRPNGALPTVSAVCWTGQRFIMGLQWNCTSTQVNIASPWVTMPPPPWGSNVASGAFCFAAASDGTHTIFVTSDRYNAAPGIPTPPGKFFWLSKDNGNSWLRYGKMPGEETLDGLCFDPMMNLFCAVGFDRATLSSVCLIGRPGMENGDYSDAGGANYWIYRRLPVAIWSGVASDGENFVAVSQDGIRFVIDLDEGEKNALGLARAQ
jgi:hypothetical protein